MAWNLLRKLNREGWSPVNIHRHHQLMLCARNKRSCQDVRWLGCWKRSNELIHGRDDLKGKSKPPHLPCTKAPSEYKVRVSAGESKPRCRPIAVISCTICAWCLNINNRQPLTLLSWWITWKMATPARTRNKTLNNLCSRFCCIQSISISICLCSDVLRPTLRIVYFA